MSLEMAQKVIVPQKKNYVPQFLKQRDINSYILSYDFKGRRVYCISHNIFSCFKYGIRKVGSVDFQYMLREDKEFARYPAV